MPKRTSRETTMGGPMHLMDLPSPPEPAPGCDVCEALGRQRTDATAAGDYSRATDYSVEIRQHPHAGKR